MNLERDTLFTVFLKYRVVQEYLHIFTLFLMPSIAKTDSPGYCTNWAADSPLTPPAGTVVSPKALMFLLFGISN